MVSLIALVALQQAPNLQTLKLQNVNGSWVAPLKSGGQKATVLVFVVPECPIAQKMMPELNRISTRFAPKGVKLYLVHADPLATATSAAKHASAYSLKPTPLLDPKLSLARAVGAKVSPEAFVFNGKGTLTYRGRINDLFADVAKPRHRATKHDLADAIAATLANKPVKTRHTQAVGCVLPNP